MFRHPTRSGVATSATSGLKGNGITWQSFWISTHAGLWAGRCQTSQMRIWIKALDMAYEQRGRPQGLMFHSDQGSPASSRGKEAIPTNEIRRREWIAAGYKSDMGSAIASCPPPDSSTIRLYNLTSVKHALSNIENRRLKVSRFADLNDPFELPPFWAKGSIRPAKSSTRLRKTKTWYSLSGHQPIR